MSLLESLMEGSDGYVGFMVNGRRQPSFSDVCLCRIVVWGVVLSFVFRFLSPYLVNRVKFFGIKMAKYLRIIGLHISKKSRTFAIAKK